MFDSVQKVLFDKINRRILFEKIQPYLFYTIFYLVKKLTHANLARNLVFVALTKNGCTIMTKTPALLLTKLLINEKTTN